MSLGERAALRYCRCNRLCTVPLELTIRSRDRLWWLLALASTVALRCCFVFAQKIDSDEPQHLHIAWAWTHGLVQYRDVFDNHLPLLHVMFAPVMAFVPESSSAFVIMRLAIAPIAIASAALLYLFVAPHFGSVVAAVAAIAFSVLPPWLPKSVEFRNDTLWIFFWLAALVLIRRPRGLAPFAAGVAFGLSFLASIKAIPLLLAHLLALATDRRRVSLRTAVRFVLGAALPVAITAIVFFAAGAFDEMVFQTLLFNAAAPVSAARRIGGAVIFAILGPIVVWMWRRRAHSENATAAHLTLFAFWYPALLLAFWPILTPRDFLPLVPVAAIAIAVRWPVRRWSIAALIVIGALLSADHARLWRTREQFRERFVDAAVSVTGRNDSVFDLKGDAVFRRRAVFYVYEDVGRSLTANGTLPDRGPEEIVARQACAAIRDSSHIPPRTRAFLNRHFIGNGPLRVCGSRVRGSMFEIGVPQTYAIDTVANRDVRIDGIPYRGPRPLAAGRHTISGVADGTTVLWWRAAKEKS